MASANRQLELPWEVLPLSYEWEVCGWFVRTARTAEDGGGYIVAECHASEQGRQVAQLLLASRRLLEALEGVVRVADRQTVEFDTARAAIALARKGGEES